MKKKIVTLFSVLALGGSGLKGQVTIQEIFFNDFITFYVSAIDIATGSQNVELFGLEILVDEPVEVVIEFTLRINSVPLGLAFDDEFLTVTTKSFILQGPVRLRNTELDANTTQLFYSGPPGGVVGIQIPEENIIQPDFTELESMQSLIMQSGRLPDGTYRFALKVTYPGGEATWEREIISASPVALELIAPGADDVISTTYPFFQWESDPCAICSYQIRVARYIAGEHGSFEDAIEDQTVWPLEQALGFYDVGNATSVPYPLTGAVDLELGGIYVWQVQKIIPTTAGDEPVNSFIWAFEIADRDEPVTSPIMIFLQSVMGTETFDQAFSAGGELEGFSPNRVITLNGDALRVDQLTAIANAIQEGTLQVITVEVQ